MRSDPSMVNNAVSRRPLAGASRRGARKQTLRRFTIEALEERALMAVLPSAIVNAQVPVNPTSGAGSANQFSPSIAVDPTNPSHLVAVWSVIDPPNLRTPGPLVIDRGAFSLNGGTSWTTFTPSPTVLDPTSTTGKALDQQTDNQVAFDHNGNFYVLTDQHNADNGTGFLFLNKFNLNSGLSRTINNNPVFAWRSDAANPPGNRRAVKPALAVDANLPTFSDVNSLGNTVTQTDPGSGNVYVAWATIDDTPSGVTVWNPNTIRMNASIDGGVSFVTPIATPFTVDPRGNGDFGQRLTAPRMTISQGDVLGHVPGGQVTIVYDDFNSGINGNPPFDILNVARVQAPQATGGALMLSGTTTVASPLIRGAVGNSYPTGTPSDPLGFGPAPVLASDNTLGAYSQFEGRLYLSYVDRFNDPNNNPADNSDIYLITSDNGGVTWSSPVRVNNDVGTTDGYSGADVFGGPTSTFTQGGRPQYQPQLAVDPTTGTLVVSFLDTRYDAARARVATMIATSIDGGATFGPETFANAPNRVFDQATNSSKVLGPIPDNESGGNNQANKDSTFAFGDYFGLAVYGGHVYPAWASNLNGGSNGKQLLQITVAQATIAAGPRVLSGTEGPVGQAGDSLNGSRAADGGPQAHSLIVTFDRPVDPNTFTNGTVNLSARDASGALLASQPVVTLVTPLNSGPLGATQFRVDFTAVSTPGTVSYTVGPGIKDRIRTATSTGNFMDENGNGVGNESNADRFSAPQPVNNTPFTAPYVRDTLPLVIPGPHVISTKVQNEVAGSTDHLVLNGTVSFIDVVFDRDMNPATFTAAQVLLVQGPAGLINGPYTITPNPLGTDPDGNHPRTYRVGFATQQLSGTYTLTLGSGIQSASGSAIDANLNAGVDTLRGTSSSNVTVTFNSTAPVAIQPARTVTSTITVNDNFLVAGLTLQLNINYPTDPDLTVTLVAPDGTAIQLFSGVGTGVQQANFTNTIFDDNAATPIANGGAAFFGRFRPSQPLGALSGFSSVTGPAGSGAGVYTLQITNNGAATGSLTAWSLSFQKPTPSNGLGEPVADRTQASFRIFTMDPTNPLASTTWTSVGPASIGGSRSGRIGGIAVDPSDPSGNTVFVAGASGGVWKTNNFLTTDPIGPTYIPVTDFGPTFGINIGSIAVFGRNNDPNKSVVVAATGEGDTGSRGVGFLISQDGGATWALMDSTDNTLPVAQRDHAFVGSTAFKVIVDPQPTVTGGVIIYAALSGNNGGIWRSLDTGKTWGVVANGNRVANRAGQATDVTFDPNSGPVDAVSNPTGNLQVLYGAFRGDGVYISPNQGQSWNLMAGGVGDPLIQDPATNPAKPIPVNNQGNSPNGGKGRIVLTKPALFPSSDPNATLKNFIYQGWLYAAVSTPDSRLDGLYLTKDNGQNWTKVLFNTLPPINNVKRGVPTNDTTQPIYDPFGSTNFAQGNYDISLVSDPTNPNVVYLGGTQDGNPTGLLRIDVTGMSDPHALYDAMDRSDGGTISFNSTDAVALKKNPDFPTISSPIINLIRNPASPLGGNATFYVTGVASFGNTGAGVKWMPFDVGVAGTTDQHRVVAIRDPLTGHARLIFGDDQGVFSVVDNGDGTVSNGIGTAASASTSRNGNLQITQFYYGAAQPSSAAAQIAGALFYGQAQDDGFPRSDPNVLNNGNIFWNGGGGDGTGVATDQTGVGTLYQYNWPCCGGNLTDFFQVNGVGRTNGLIQSSTGTPAPDPQWPFLGGFNFAVNPINGNQIVISSGAGRIFRTEDQGRNWLVIGDPAIFSGNNAPALAYGAPDPGATSAASLENFIYAGTTAGHIFVTFTGGGANGTAWFDITNGALAADGSGVQAIVANPNRGSHEAYAVTSNGVYTISDSRPSANATWQKITGNLFTFQQSPFGNAAQASTKLAYLTSLTADWRYVIPDNFANPNGPTHPILYAAGEGGVYRSLDKGQTWSLFPSQEPNSTINQPIPPGAGGGLPNAHVTDLDLSTGNVDPTTGRSVAQAGDPNVLLATTFGRGSFAIRLAPVVFASSLALDPNLPAPGGSANGTTTNGTPLSTVAQPVFDGFSEQTAFGNVVRITLIDLTDPANPKVIGGYDGTGGTDTAANRTDPFGRFAIQVNPGAFTSNGLKTIGVQATDASGTKGNIATFKFTLNAQLVNVNVPPVQPTIQLLPSDDSSGGLKVTNVKNPHIVGVTDALVTVKLFLSSNGQPTGAPLQTTTTDANGNYSLIVPYQGDGSYTLQTVATNTFGSTNSPPLSLQIKTNAPTTMPTVGIRPADDTGIKGDGVTSNRIPHFDGTADPLAKIQLYQVVNGVRIPISIQPTTADANGHFTIQLPSALSNGSITIQVGETDVAGNLGPYSNAVTVSIVTVTGDYTGVGQTTPALFRRDTAGTGLWIIAAVSPPGGIPFGSSSLDIPFSGDFDGAGKAELAFYRPSTHTWDLKKVSGDSVFNLGGPGDIPVAGDFEGTGVVDVGVFNPSTGLWTIAFSTGVATLGPVTAPKAGDIPVPGNYDGTGRDELAVYRPSTGDFFIASPSQVTNLKVKTAAGATGDIPVPGDYDNTAAVRKTEPAVFNPTSGKYTILGPGGVTRTIQFQPGDVPAPGDYLATGRTQAAVVRPTPGTGLDQFFVDNGASGTITLGPLGKAGDIPVLSPLFYRNVITKTPTLALDPASDTGFKGDGITSSRRPFFSGATDPSAVVDLINTANNQVLGTGVADANGNFRVQLSPNKDLANGSYAIQARAHGVLGSAGPVSPPVTVTLATVDSDYIGAGIATQAVFRRASPSLGQWFIANYAKAGGPGFGSGSLDVPMEGDIDGDGRVDLILFRPSTGKFFAQQSSTGYLGTTLTTTFVAQSTDIPLVGNFNGTGKAVVAVYRPSTGEWFINGSASPVTFIAPRTGDVPVPGDYQNVGKDQLAIFRPSTGQWFINGTGGTVSILFGGPTDIPVPGIYDVPGAGRKVEPGVFRPSTGQYFVHGATGNRGYQFAFNDIPTSGDYQANGLTEPAVFRPSTLQWLVFTPASATTPGVLPVFGGPNDIPTNAPYVYRALPGFKNGKVGGGISLMSVASAATTVVSPAAATSSSASTLTPAPAASPTGPAAAFRSKHRAHAVKAQGHAVAAQRSAVTQASASAKRPGQLF
jgi:hypothetical protein